MSRYRLRLAKGPAAWEMTVRGLGLSAGGLTRPLFAASRDRAARPVSVTDDAGRTTTYAYADGGRTVTETLPGGGTRVRAFWPGGLARSVTGAAAAPPV